MSITVEDFKNYFTRPFPYLPVWDATVSYNEAETVYYETTRLFYTANSDSVPAGTLPTNTTYFTKVTDDVYNYISDTDIQNAINLSDTLINVSLFDDTTLTQAQLYLSAHCLCYLIRATNGGLASRISFPEQSKSAGSISQSFSIPKNYLEKEIYNFYINSEWGLLYLTLFIPRSKGNMAIAYGWTQA